MLDTHAHWRNEPTRRYYAHEAQLYGSEPIRRYSSDNVRYYTYSTPTKSVITQPSVTYHRSSNYDSANMHQYVRFREEKQVVLHPDTMMPVSSASIQVMAEGSPLHRQLTKRHDQIAQVRIDGSWNLGIAITKEGLVRSVQDNTPASRARIIFESKVLICCFEQEPPDFTH